MPSQAKLQVTPLHMNSDVRDRLNVRNVGEATITIVDVILGTNSDDKKGFEVKAEITQTILKPWQEAVISFYQKPNERFFQGIILYENESGEKGHIAFTLHM